MLRRQLPGLAHAVIMLLCLVLLWLLPRQRRLCVSVVPVRTVRDTLRRKFQVACPAGRQMVPRWMHSGWRRLHVRCESVRDQPLLCRRSEAAYGCCWRRLCLLLVASLALEHEECLHEQLVRGADGAACWISHACLIWAAVTRCGHAHTHVVTHTQDVTHTAYGQAGELECTLFHVLRSCFSAKIRLILVPVTV